MQKKVYKTILEKNAELLRSIGEARKKKARTKPKTAPPAVVTTTAVDEDVSTTPLTATKTGGEAKTV